MLSDFEGEPGMAPNLIDGCESELAEVDLQVLHCQLYIMQLFQLIRLLYCGFRVGNDQSNPTQQQKTEKERVRFDQFVDRGTAKGCLIHFSLHI